jgi:tetratricopeptide (TPR) repeat protein
MAYQKAIELDSTNPEAWSRLGHTHRRLKQFNLAETAYKKARSLGTTGIADKALSLANIGLLNQSKGKLRKAEIAFLNALKIYTEIDNEQGIASTSENLANVYKNLNLLDKAEKHYLSTLAIHTKNNSFQNTATLNTTLADLYQQQKLTGKAQSHYETALRISQENSFKGNFANLYNKLALLAQQNGDVEKSQNYFNKSLNFSNDLKQSVGSADQYGKLAIKNRNLKKYDVAEDYHKKAIAIYQQNNHINGVISQKINLGFLYKIWQKKQLACDIWHDSLTLLKSTKSSRTDRIVKLLQNNNCK